jgi:hypothetical protein
VLLTFISFRTMVALGTLFPLLAIIGLFLQNRLVENRWYLVVMMAAIPLPYVAIQAGWLLADWAVNLDCLRIDAYIGRCITRGDLAGAGIPGGLCYGLWFAGGCGLLSDR